MRDPRPFLGGVGEELQNSTRARFGTESGPDGTPWQPLAASTIRQKQKKGQQLSILTATKALESEIIWQHDGDGVRIGSNKPYAAIHQLGGTIVKPARTGKAFGRQDVTIKAHTINIPARPFLGISSDDEQNIIQLAQDWLDTE